MSESHLIVGKKLLDSQKVAVLYESERNLWVAEVDGIEIEIQITPSKVKACSCECAFFQNERMCSHVAAGLLALRKLLSDKKEAANSPKKTYQKLTINAILDQVDKEELSAFIRYYAGAHRQFAISLKTRFAAKVPMSDDSEKYCQVVDLVLKSARNKNDKISVAGAKQLLSTGFDLLGQANDTLSLEHYVDCWSVLRVLIDKIVPVLNRTEFEVSRFLQFSESCFDLIGRLAERPIPPALKSEVWVFLLEIANRPIYRGYDLAVNIFRQLRPLADDKSKATQLLQVVEYELRNELSISEGYRKELLSVKLAILQKKGFGKISKSYFKEVLASPELVLTIASIALEKEIIDVAKMLTTNGLNLSKNHLYQQRMKMLLLDIAIAGKDAEGIVEWSKGCFVLTGNIKYVRLCKQYYTGDWKQFMKQLVEKFSTSNLLHLHEYLANLYGEEKCIPELIEIARKEGTVDFLMKYDRYFLPEHANQLYGIYVEILDGYFKNHLGIKPTKKMLALFDHLRQLKATRLLDKLADFIRKNYPERLELAMEMME